jgi:hypothetical protein
MVEFLYFVCLLGVASKMSASPISLTDVKDKYGSDLEDVRVPGKFLVNYEHLLNSDEDMSYPILPLPDNPPEWLMTLIHNTMVRSSGFSNRQKRAYQDYSDPRLQAILRAFYSTYSEYGTMGIRYGRSVRSLQRRGAPLQRRILHNSFLKQMKANTHSRGRFQRSLYRRADIQRLLRLFYSSGKKFGRFGLQYR